MGRSAKDIVRKQKMARLLEMMLDLQRDWTVEEMCDEIGITRSTYYRWTKGELGQLVARLKPPEEYAEATRLLFLKNLDDVNNLLVRMATGQYMDGDQAIRPRDILAAQKLFYEKTGVEIKLPEDRREGEAKKFLEQYRPIQVNILMPPGTVPAGLLPVSEEEEGGEVVEGEYEEVGEA